MGQQKGNMQNKNYKFVSDDLPGKTNIYSF